MMKCYVKRHPDFVYNPMWPDDQCHLVHVDPELRPPLRHRQREHGVEGDRAQRHPGVRGAAGVGLAE